MLHMLEASPQNNNGGGNGGGKGKDCGVECLREVIPGNK